jgi:hypothetical protein
MTLDALIKIMKVPQTPVESAGSWQNVENIIGTVLPSDFKNFIEKYGSGSINNFLYIFNPFSERKQLNLAYRLKEQIGVLLELKNSFGEEIPFDFFPSKNSLLPLGMTENGDVVHWLTNSDPNKWSIVVNESRSSDFQCFEMGLTDFLVSLFSNPSFCRAFPAGVFENEVNFCSI